MAKDKGIVEGAVGSNIRGVAGGGPGGGAPIKTKAYKVSKIMVWPTRKINLGAYNTAELSAGLEIAFDKPVELDSKDMINAFDEARTIIREEFKKQYEPLRAIIEKNKGGE